MKDKQHSKDEQHKKAVTLALTLNLKLPAAPSSYSFAILLSGLPMVFLMYVSQVYVVVCLGVSCVFVMFLRPILYVFHVLLRLILCVCILCFSDLYNLASFPGPF